VLSSCGAVGNVPLCVWSAHVNRCATDDISGRRSAVKKLTDVFATTQSARRAHRELTSLTALRHDNVGSCYVSLSLSNQTGLIRILTHINIKSFTNYIPRILWRVNKFNSLTHLLTHSLTCLPTYLLTYLQAYFSTYTNHVCTGKNSSVNIPGHGYQNTGTPIIASHQR
jgi:hypothetical protein